jgi:hypothetical protein
LVTTIRRCTAAASMTCRCFPPADIASDHRGDAVLVASTMFDSAICEDLRARGCESVVPVGYLNLRLPEIFRAREYALDTHHWVNGTRTTQETASSDASGFWTTWARKAAHGA